jgi:hypothetical protein
MTLPDAPVTWVLVLIIGALALTLLVEAGALVLFWFGVIGP